MGRTVGSRYLVVKFIFGQLLFYSLLSEINRLKSPAYTNIMQITTVTKLNYSNQIVSISAGIEILI